MDEMTVGSCLIALLLMGCKIAGSYLSDSFEVVLLYLIDVYLLLDYITLITVIFQLLNKIRFT